MGSRLSYGGLSPVPTDTIVQGPKLREMTSQAFS